MKTIHAQLLGTLVVIVIVAVGISIAKKNDSTPLCTAAATPKISNLAYDDARVKIIVAGWTPVQKYSTLNDFPSTTGNTTIFWNKGYTELQNCAGTGLGQCQFTFQDSCNNYLHVSTGGEESTMSHPIVQSIYVGDSK